MREHTLNHIARTKDEALAASRIWEGMGPQFNVCFWYRSAAGKWIALLYYEDFRELRESVPFSKLLDTELVARYPEVSSLADALASLDPYVLDEDLDTMPPSDDEHCAACRDAYAKIEACVSAILGC
ncbi:MAG: hypothetical protein RIS47_1086 [Bacteroidota bacterium]